MKILSKEEYSSTTYYEVWGETNNGDKVVGTLAVMWEDNGAVADYDFNFLKDESDTELTDSEIDEFKELAINFV